MPRPKKTPATTEDKIAQQVVKSVQQPNQNKLRKLIALKQKWEKDHPGCHFLLGYELPPDPGNIRRPCGIMPLDIDTGGGLPAGKMVKIAGDDNAGKTSLLYLYMAMNQRIYGEDSVVALAATEYYPDYFQMRKLGCMVPIPTEILDNIDLARTSRGMPPYTGDERKELQTGIGQFVLLRSNDGEGLLMETLALLESNMCQIIGIDSMNMVQPNAEQVKDLDHDAKMAAQASLVTRFQRELHNEVMRLDRQQLNRTTIIEINQMRANTKGGPYQSEKKVAQDYASKHGSATTLRLSSGEKIRHGKGETATVIGKHWIWDVVKGKHGTHDNIRGSWRYMYESLFDIFGSVLVSGIAYGTIVEKAGQLSVAGPTGEIVLENVDAAKFRQVLRDDPKLDLLVRTAIMNKAGVENAVLCDTSVLS